MDKRLHLLETFSVRGTDGRDYVVYGYEHLSRLDGAPDVLDSWTPTGLAEYKLAGGERVVVDRGGAMSVAGSGIGLTRLGAN